MFTKYFSKVYSTIHLNATHTTRIGNGEVRYGKGMYSVTSLFSFIPTTLGMPDPTKQGKNDFACQDARIMQGAHHISYSLNQLPIHKLT